MRGQTEGLWWERHPSPTMGTARPVLPRGRAGALFPGSRFIVKPLVSRPERQNPPAKRFPLPPCPLRARLLGVPRSQPPLSGRNNKYSRLHKKHLVSSVAKPGPGRLGASSRIPQLSQLEGRSPGEAALAVKLRPPEEANESSALKHRQGAPRRVCVPRVPSLHRAGCQQQVN